MKKEMAFGVLISALLALVLLFAGCGGPKPTPTLTPTTTPGPASTPSLTSTQAMGLVAASLRAAASLIVRDSAGYFKAEFNYSSRQWVVTVWKTKEDSEKYLGDVYIVDDATGKVLNPPPAYNPKSSQSTQSSEPTLTAPIVPSAPTVPPAAEAPLVPTGSQVIESRVDGEFQGWDGETIFRLTNGQIWQQAEYSYLYHYAYMPRVTIFSVSGGYKMQVDGVNKAIRVQRLR